MKNKSQVEVVDGINCSYNLASGIVVVGSGLVGHDRRDCFRLKAGRTLEAQVRARPRFAALAAAAAGEQPATTVADDSEISAAAAPPPRRRATPAITQTTSVLFGNTRTLPSRQPVGAHNSFAPSLLENDLGRALGDQDKGAARGRARGTEAARA